MKFQLWIIHRNDRYQLMLINYDEYSIMLTSRRSVNECKEIAAEVFKVALFWEPDPMEMAEQIAKVVILQ